MQVTPEFVVTNLPGKEGRLRRVSYGPYNTTCLPESVWGVKQQLKLLPVTCPACGKISAPG